MGKKSGVRETAPLCANSGIEKTRQLDSVEPADPATYLGPSLSAVVSNRALEPRILLDAAGVETADTVISSLAAQQAERYFDQPLSAPKSAGEAGLDVEAEYDVPELGAPPQFAGEGEAVGADPADGADRQADLKQVVFIDPGVENSETIIATLGPNVEVVMLDGESDGVSQIAEYLEGREGIDALHIISHGRSGTLELGDSQLTETSINGKHADELAIIRTSLSADADLLIYGCNFGDGTRGASAVEALAGATGADVAASDDATGAAALGGDWDLEVASGAIEATTISAPDWDYTLAPLTISTTALPTITGATGTDGATGLQSGVAGFTALWTNAGDIGGTSIDIRATVVSVTGGATVSAYTIGDDPSIIINNGGGSAVVIWEIFVSGTGQTVLAVGTPNFQIADIDGVGGAANSRETVIPQLNGLSSYTVDDPTNLVTTISGAGVNVSGTQNQSAETNSLVAFTWEEVSSWTVNYSLNPAAGFVNAVFQHDGDGDFTFVNADMTTMLSLDHDGDDSTATGTAYDTTYTENAPPIPIVDTDVVIAQHAALGTDLHSATVTLTNAQAGDQLLVNGSTAASGTVSGVNYTITNSGGQIEISLSGTASVATYETILGLITFENTTDTPDTTDRNITVNVTNGTFGTTSNAANSTIHVTAVNDDPVAADDGPVPLTEDTTATGNVIIDAPGVDTDSDGDTLTVTDFSITGEVGPFTVGTPYLISGVGTFTLNSTGAYTFAPVSNYFGPVPQVTYTVSDGNGGSDSATLTFADVAAVNDPPVLNLDPDNDSGTPGDTSDDGADDGGFETTFNENDPALAIVDTDMTIGDADDDIAEVIVTLTNGQIGDTLNPPGTLPGGITAAVVPATTLAAPGSITITFTGTAATTSADWAALLQSITFEPSMTNSESPDPADRNITIEALDAGMNSSGVVETVIHVVPVNDPPTLDLDDDNSSLATGGNYQGTYVENTPGVAISDGVLITDPDDTQLEGMTITLTNGEAGDILNIGTLPPGISLVGLPPTELMAPGTITVQLTGSASLSDYQDAIAAITFLSNGDDPVAGIREITVVGNDGDEPTEARTAFITVQPVNDPPVVVDPLTPGVPPIDPNAVIPAQTADDSTAVTPLDASQYFSDPDDTFMLYSLDVSAPSWLSIDPISGVISGMPPSDASQNSNTGTPGEYDVIIIAEDLSGLTAQTTATYTVSNPAPDAAGDAFITNENDLAITGNVVTVNNGSGPDSDPDGDTPLTVIEVGGDAVDVGAATAGTSGGLFTITSTGGFIFDDNGDFEDLADGETRDTTITYTISDGEGGVDTATVTVTVTGTNDAPVVVSGNEVPDATGDDGETITSFNVSSAFNDPDTTDTLTYTASGLPAGLTLNPVTGEVSGTIDPSASQNGNTGPATDGVYTIVVTANDGNGGTVTDTFIYTISNLPPDAQNDALTGDEDSVVSGLDVLSNNGSGADTDPEGDTPLTVSEVDGDAANVGAATAGDNGGLFTIDANGSLTFDPDGDFDYLADGQSATTSIIYQLSDGEGGFDVATVTYTVTGVNDDPVPVDPLNLLVPPADPNDYIPVQPGADAQPTTPLDVTLYVTDPDTTDTLTFLIPPGELPPGLVFDGTTISGVLDPAASQGGDDPIGNPGVYLVPLTVTDGNGGTFTTTITYDISNPPPVAADDAVTGDEDSVINGDLLVNNGSGADIDSDGDTLSVTRVAPGNSEAVLAGLSNGTGIAPATVTGSTGGTFTVNSDGAFSFDPGTDFQDLDDGEIRVTEIVYQIDDGEGGTDTAVVSFTVTGSNDAPVVIDPNDPFPNPNEPPVPADPNNIIPDVSGNDGEALTPLDISPYFVDVDDEPLTFGFDPLDPDVPSWLSIDPFTGVITGTPPADASQGGPNSDGIYPITLIATDPDGETVTTTIDFTITNLPPLAQSDASTGDEDNDQSGNVLTDPLTGDNDTVPDSDPLTVTDVDGNPVTPGGPATIPLTYGTLTMNADGSWLFEPNSAANQLNDTDPAVIETVTYTIDDGNGGTDTATLEITINGVNDPVQVIDPNDPSTDPTDPSYDPTNPTVIADPDNLIPDVAYDDGDTTVAIPAGDYFADAEGDTLSFSAADLPAGLTIDPVTGLISGTIGPDASQNGNGGPGIYNVVITAEDPSGNIATATITYTVTNIAPTAQDDALTHGEDGSATGDVFADNGNGIDQDTPSDTDPITVSEVDGDAANVGTPAAGDNGGEFIINPDGTYTFDPGTDFQDLDDGETRDTAITYTIDDGNGGTDTATITVTVQGANDAPVVIDPNDPVPNPNEPPVPADPANVIPDVTGNDGEALTLDISSYFVDVDGEPLTFGFDPLDPDVPAWLSIDPLTGVITGTPPADASQGGPNSDGVYPITLTATDPDGETVTTTLDFTITNIAPTAVDDAVAHGEDGSATGDVFADNGNGIDQDSPPDTDPITVSEVDGDAVNVGSPTPGDNGGSFTINPDGTYTFDPGADFQDLDDGETRDTAITYTIDDGNGGTDTATITVTVRGANDAPVVIDPLDPVPNPNEPPVPADPANVIPDQNAEDSSPLTPLDISPYFVDVDGEPLTFGFDPLDPDVPAWLSIDPLTGVITGTPPSDASIGSLNGDGIYSIKVTATDPDGESVTTTVDFTITNPPPIATSLEDQTETAGEDFVYDTAGSFSDPDGDVLTFTATGLPAGLIIDPATGQISGTIDGAAVPDAPDGNGTYVVTVTADDGQGGTVSTDFTFKINDPVSPESPVPAGPPTDPTGEAGRSVPPPTSELILDSATNGLTVLGGDTGIFNTDHPLTAALFQLSPLSNGVSLDEEGLPVSQMVEWVELTQGILADTTGPDGPLWHAGGDSRVAVGNSEYILRTLVADEVIFIETLSDDPHMIWEIDSINGVSAAHDFDRYGNNLLALPAPKLGSSSNIVLIGSDRNGAEVIIEIEMGVTAGQFRILSITGSEQAAGFSGQLQTLFNKPLNEARALLQKTS